jgi:hypothetical protein
MLQDQSFLVTARDFHPAPSALGGIQRPSQIAGIQADAE